MENRGECTLLELERRLYRLGDALTGSQLPAHDVENFRSLVAAGEPGVALENLCAQLQSRAADAALDGRHRIRQGW